jgi:molybdopterin converting factor small subunit
MEIKEQMTPTLGTAKVKLLGHLSHKPDGSKLVSEEISAPLSLSSLLQLLRIRHGLELQKEDILVVVNGVESGALNGLETVINAQDEVVFVPMFHGGLYRP